ncbi:antigen LPMC-61-like [Anopheles albimanus]|uniref:antigen LPMC-61-like n=1 Tax=Anopheles albimanus TaxID=7167 RepID=UPI00163F47A6|nr:antigen LPMC-61-like [Anopheles albimanus]
MRGFGGNGPYTVIVAMLCFGVGLDAIYLERPVWEVDVGGRKPHPLLMPQQSYGGSAESERGDWGWNNPDLMYYQPEYNGAEYELQQPDSNESQLSEGTHFQEAQQASQMKKPVSEAVEEQMPYLAPRPYGVPQPMEQDREDGWGKPMLYQPNWQSETAPAPRPYQSPQQLEQQSRPPKPIQMPPRAPGDRQQGQWAEKGPEYELKESSPSSTADRLLQLQMQQQQQWMQEQQLKQQELVQQQNLLRQQEMMQQQLKQQQLLHYNQQPEYYAGSNDDDDDAYEPVPYQKPVISVDARCPRNDDPAKPVHLPSTSCSKFMKCFNGIAYEMSCPGGLEFDKKTNRCDYAAIARCSKP